MGCRRGQGPGETISRETTDGDEKEKRGGGKEGKEKEEQAIRDSL